MNIMQSEINGVLWKRLMAHIEASIAAKHASLEKPLGVDETANIRGQIKALRSIQKIKPGQPDPITE